MAAKRRIRLLWGLLAIATIVLLLKSFVADVYPVRSLSMRPTLFDGASGPEGEATPEYVLVVYERNAKPERFALVVIRPRGGGNPIVKRVVGLPREAVQITAGDVLIGGNRLGPDAARPGPIPVFDDHHQAVADFFGLDETIWVEEQGEWRLDASEVPSGANAGMMTFREYVRDDYLDRDGRRVCGTRQVNDVAIECGVLLEEAQGRLRWQLSEEGDKFEAVIRPATDGATGFVLALTRYNEKTAASTDAEKKTAILLEMDVPFESGRWHHVRFFNVDNHLILELDGGEFRAVASYDANEPRANASAGNPSPVPQTAFGGEGTRARFRDIRVLRDLYYTEKSARYAPGEGLTRPPGRPEPSERVSLGPGWYYVLGDNSAHSTDSRSFGPVEAAEIVGRPVAVVWPLSRARGL